MTYKWHIFIVLYLFDNYLVLTVQFFLKLFQNTLKNPKNTYISIWIYTYTYTIAISQYSSFYTSWNYRIIYTEWRMPTPVIYTSMIPLDRGEASFGISANIRNLCPKLYWIINSTFNKIQSDKNYSVILLWLTLHIKWRVCQPNHVTKLWKGKVSVCDLRV